MNYAKFVSFLLLNNSGAPNFRQVPLTLARSFVIPIQFSASPSSSAVSSPQGSFVLEATSRETNYVYGVAMPTKDAIRRLCNRVDAGIGGNKTILWTSLREEPVVYVNGKFTAISLVAYL